MSDDQSARLGLPYLAAGQMQKHVTLNEALTRLDALVQTAAISRTVSDQPATPADGALYILPAGATHRINPFRLVPCASQAAPRWRAQSHR